MPTTPCKPPVDVIMPVKDCCSLVQCKCLNNSIVLLKSKGLVSEDLLLECLLHSAHINWSAPVSVEHRRKKIV